MTRLGSPSEALSSSLRTRNRRVIPAPFLGSGRYLIDVQNRKASSDPELVEGGQLLLLISPGKPVG
jgi:hypothetical protein